MSIYIAESINQQQVPVECFSHVGVIYIQNCTQLTKFQAKMFCTQWLLIERYFVYAYVYGPQDLFACVAQRDKHLHQSWCDAMHGICTVCRCIGSHTHRALCHNHSILLQKLLNVWTPFRVLFVKEACIPLKQRNGQSIYSLHCTTGCSCMWSPINTACSACERATIASGSVVIPASSMMH